MRHERHFAEAARAVVGIEHLVQYLRATRSLGLDNPAFFETNLDVVYQRTLVRERLGA